MTDSSILKKNEMGQPPSNYAGWWPRGYAIVERNRDSKLLEQSNWSAAIRRLEEAAQGLENRGWFIHRARHWAVGWVETLVVQTDAPTPVLEEAAIILQDLEAYPVLDEDDYSDRIYNAALDFWDDLSDDEKIHYGGDPNNLEQVSEEVLEMAEEW